MNFKNMSIRTKLTIPYVILSLIVAISGSYAITTFIVGSIEKRFNNTLIETGKIVSDLIVQQENQQLETLRLISFIDGLPELISADDSEGLREMILPIVVNYNVQAVEIFDISGNSAISIRRDRFGDFGSYDFLKGDDEFENLPFINNVLEGFEDKQGDIFVDVVNLNNNEFLFVAGPIYNTDGDLAGIVLVGHSLDLLLLDIKQETLAQSTIYELNGDVLASTFINSKVIDSITANSIIESHGESTYSRDYSTNDIFYSEIVYVWELRDQEVNGLIGIAMTKDFLVETSQSTGANIFLLVLVIIIFIIMIGLYLAKHITTPIYKLRDAAKIVSDGDLSIQVDPIGEDEVAQLTISFNNMINNLNESKDELQSAYEKTLLGWSKALELRDEDTQGHTERVTKITMDLANMLGVPENELDDYRRGSLLHDIGKVGVPDKILRKPGKLTSEEFDIMKEHTNHAKTMLDEIPFLKSAIDIPYGHHERWDGSGYPLGLKGEEIPFSARIFAFADVWDALVSDRVYRKAMPFEKAKMIIEDSGGTHFDPELTDFFINHYVEKLRK